MPERETATRAPLVLIANDQEWSARSLESILVPNGYTVIRAYTGQQALERALSARPDLVILDAQMPDVHGIEVCRLLREDPRFGATIPILITTAGPSGRVQRLDAYRAGAWEFLGQPLDGESLLLKLGTYLAAKRDADRTRDESLLDHDTGLYNMRGLSRRAREIGSEVYRRRQPLACLVLAAESRDADVPTQQRLTGELGRLLRDRGRSSDAIGRLGDGEFGVIAPATEARGALRLFERIQQSLSPLPHDGPQPLSLQAGYSVVPDFGVAAIDAVELLLRATTALRELRGAGSAERIRLFQPDIAPAV
ncbi:MAG: response regulator [Gemmatimonadota bacterium]|nr:response regulator [Gemmatimonadota bacterium]